jgi:nitrogen fixation/metabolism regulation signal transduction histidine kinase
LSDTEVPAAAVVKDGKLGGDVPKGGAGRPKYKRKLANYLLDKKLQLRYVVLVTALSAVISGALGYMIYRQEDQASQALAADLKTFTNDEELQREITANMEEGDQQLIFMMAGVGLGLVLVLSLYLVVMTHKVAGPLYKISHYFDKMAQGKLGKVTNLRKGDMLQDFYGNFREMHDAVRARQTADNEAMLKFVEAAMAAGMTGAELEALMAHARTRRDALA